MAGARILAPTSLGSRLSDAIELVACFGEHNFFDAAPGQHLASHTDTGCCLLDLVVETLLETGQLLQLVVGKEASQEHLLGSIPFQPYAGEASLSGRTIQ